MSYLVPPITQPFAHNVQLPGSKSIALRQLVMASLCEGASRLTGIPPCDDTAAMLDCLAALGAGVTVEDETSVTITGPINLGTDNINLNARLSGASTRLLIGLAALRRGKTHIDGHPSLRRRPNEPLYAVLRAHGCQIDSTSGGLPVTIQGPLQAPTKLVIEGSLSSQYITALMITAPYFQADEQHIELCGDVVSKPYLNITINEMAKRGGAARWLNDKTLAISPQRYLPGDNQIEGDATSASYFLGLATLHGSEVTLTNLGQSSVQGDYRFTEVMTALGAEIETLHDQTRLRGPAQLAGLTQIDLTDMPDAAVTLMTMAPFFSEPITITGLSTLKHKECDRLACPAHEMAQLGIQCQATDAAIQISPCHDFATHTLSTYHDHRMAMAFSLIGSKTGTLTVDEPRVVDKTYPNYWRDYEGLLA